MNRKKAITAFSIITVFKFVLGAVVVLLLLSLVWTFLSPQKAAEASTRKALDDIVVKMNTNAFEAGQTVIAYGYVDKDAAIIGFNSDQLKAGKVDRPKKQCGSHLNSCICAFKVEYGREGFLGLETVIKPTKVIECKGFPSSRISAIKGSTDDSLNNRYQEKNGFDFAIIGGSGASFTSEMTLSENGLLSIKSKITRTVEVVRA